MKELEYIHFKSREELREWLHQNNLLSLDNCPIFTDKYPYPEYEKASNYKDIWY